MRKSAINDLEVNVTLFRRYIKLRFRIGNIQIEAKNKWGRKRKMTIHGRRELRTEWEDKEFGKMAGGP